MFFNYLSESLFYLQASDLFPSTKRPLPRSLFAVFVSLIEIPFNLCAVNILITLGLEEARETI